MLNILSFFPTVSVTLIKDLVSPHKFTSFLSEPGQSEALNSLVNPWGKSNCSYSFMNQYDRRKRAELTLYICCISNVNSLLSSGNLKITFWLSRGCP